MICAACRKAGTKKKTLSKIRWHKRCKGFTWCTCQHRVAEEKEENGSKETD